MPERSSPSSLTELGGILQEARLSGSRSGRAGNEARRERVLEQFRKEWRIGLFTSACLGWNCASLLSVSDYWLSWIFGFPRPSSHWSVKTSLCFINASNALTDIILVLVLYYQNVLVKKRTNDWPLVGLVKLFICWNAFTTSLLWIVLCLDLFFPSEKPSFPSRLDATIPDHQHNATTTAETNSLQAGSYILAILEFTGIATFKAFILFYVYLDYLRFLQEDVPGTTAENAISFGGSSCLHTDLDASWDLFVWRRKQSGHSSISQPPKPTAMDRLQNNVTSPRPVLPARDVDHPGSLQPVILEHWFDQGAPISVGAPEEGTERAPLAFAPNRTPVNYMIPAGTPVRENRTHSSQQRAARPVSSFEAMHMALLGGMLKRGSRRGRRPGGKKSEAESTYDTGSSSMSKLPSGESTTLLKSSAASTAELNFEDDIERMRQRMLAERQKASQKAGDHPIGVSATNVELPKPIVVPVVAHTLPQDGLRFNQPRPHQEGNLGNTHLSQANEEQTCKDHTTAGVPQTIPAGTSGVEQPLPPAYDGGQSHTTKAGQSKEQIPAGFGSTPADMQSKKYAAITSKDQAKDTVPLLPTVEIADVPLAPQATEGRQARVTFAQEIDTNPPEGHRIDRICPEDDSRHSLLLCGPDVDLNQGSVGGSSILTEASSVGNEVVCSSDNAPSVSWLSGVSKETPADSTKDSTHGKDASEGQSPKEEDHSTEMVTGSFSVETAHTDKM